MSYLQVAILTHVKISWKTYRKSIRAFGHIFLNLGAS